MSNPSSELHQVDPLTEEQIARFKRDGMLVLPGVLDADLCRRARDQMWEIIDEHRPAMRRGDPATWVPFSEEEKASYRREETGGDPYFSGSNHRYYIRNGVEELLLNLAPRALWRVAEQLLGEGEVVWPAGADEAGETTGPCLLTDRTVKGFEPHLGGEPERWIGPVTGRTEQVRLPRTGPTWMTGQGTRGLYCTLPNSPPPAPHYRGAHAEALYDTRWRIQIAAYIDDLPEKAGGLTLFPGSHRRIWDHREALHRGHAAARRAGGVAGVERVHRPPAPGDQGRHRAGGDHRALGLGRALAREPAPHGGAEPAQRRHPPGDDLRLRQDHRVGAGRGGQAGPQRRSVAGLVGGGALDRAGGVERTHAARRPHGIGVLSAAAWRGGPLERRPRSVRSCPRR